MVFHTRLSSFVTSFHWFNIDIYLYLYQTLKHRYIDCIYLISSVNLKLTEYLIQNVLIVTLLINRIHVDNVRLPFDFLRKLNTKRL